MGGMNRVDANFNRRRFLQNSAGAMVGFGLAGAGATCAFAAGSETVAARGTSTSDAASLAGRIYKAAKWQMIEVDGSLVDKFRLQKELGYDGMELISPFEFSAADVRAASEATGMPVHGVVDMKHWDIRLSSPDPNVRAEGVAFLEQSLRDAKAFGGDTVLLVPGRVGAGESHQEVWDRSLAEVRKVLPLASKLGVRILIENVWNGFCETPEEYRDYVDAFESPWVGAYFDIGNCRKFGQSEDWVRTLGPRIVKLDCKDWSESGGFGKIGDGAVDWPAVRQALAEIEFTGWCTAEVQGGGRDELADIVARMNRVLQLG
jgi:L-ribulose-5-phosphate 3-epimerase